MNAVKAGGGVSGCGLGTGRQSGCKGRFGVLATAIWGPACKRGANKAPRNQSWQKPPQKIFFSVAPTLPLSRLGPAVTWRQVSPPKAADQPALRKRVRAMRACHVQSFPVCLRHRLLHQKNLAVSTTNHTVNVIVYLLDKETRKKLRRQPK